MTTPQRVWLPSTVGVQPGDFVTVGGVRHFVTAVFDSNVVEAIRMPDDASPAFSKRELAALERLKARVQKERT